MGDQISPGEQWGMRDLVLYQGYSAIEGGGFWLTDLVGFLLKFEFLRTPQEWSLAEKEETGFLRYKMNRVFNLSVVKGEGD